MERWAADDLRSVNAQIEYVLRQALVKQGRVKLVEKVVVEVEEIDSTQKDNWTRNSRESAIFSIWSSLAKA